MNKKWLLFPAFGLALVVNPYLACSSNETEYTYSESDMQAATLGTWQGTARVDGEDVEFSLVLEQASAKAKTQSLTPPKAQPQCNSRSFVKPAGACFVTTTMPVTGTVTSVNPDFNGTVDGEVWAGISFPPIELSLRLEDGKQLSGSIRGDSLSDGDISNKANVGTFSLSRP